MMTLEGDPRLASLQMKTPNIHSFCLVVKEMQIKAMRGHFFPPVKLGEFLFFNDTGQYWREYLKLGILMILPLVGV